MTFVQLQDSVLSRVTQTSTDARTRIKGHINRRLRTIATKSNCARVRWGSISINTVASTATITTTGLVKPSIVRIIAQNRVLYERTMDQIRLLDPNESMTGVPDYYAVQNYNAITTTMRLFRIPDAIYAVTIEGILKGTDLSADADVPGLPEDFHDMLEAGALADEFKHLRNLDDYAVEEAVWRERLSDLKMYIAKSKFLTNVALPDDGSPWWAQPATI